jgi:pentatricopeptide repeat protein
MRSAGISLDVVSYNTLIDGCIEMDDNIGALGFFKEMRMKGIAPSEVSYTTLMKAFGRNGQPHQVHQVFEEMQQDANMRTDAFAWNVLLDSYCRSGRMADAQRMFHKMKEARFALLSLCVSVPSLTVCICENSTRLKQIHRSTYSVLVIVLPAI